MTAIQPSAFSDHDFDLLEAWLVRRRKGITDIIQLGGFLTAVIIGPVTLLPSVWLPKVVGGRNPEFRTEKEFGEFLRLVMGYYNYIAAWFESDPEGFEPNFYERREKGRRIVIVDEWCEGFMKGLRLNSAEWKPLRQERPELLKPMQLFGTRLGLRERLIGEPKVMHGMWSPMIAPAVRAIHAYWLPTRHAEFEALGAGRVLH